MRINIGKRVCIPRSLSVSRELTVPCQYTEFQKGSVFFLFSFFSYKKKKGSVKIKVEEKQRETCMLSSFFKREPRTNSTLPIQRISKQSVKINPEDKQHPRCGKVNYIVSFKGKLKF